MGKIIDYKINTFNGGITEDKRVKTANKFSLTKHFDVFTYPHKMVPYHKTEAIETKNLDIVKFLYFKNSAGTARFVGYGVVAGTTKAAVYEQALGTDNAWGGLTNNESSNTGRNEAVFFYYKDFIYMWRTNTLMRFSTTGAAWGDSYQSISYTNLAQPVHHPSDDIAYFFSDNNVHKLDNTSWTSNVLTLPSDLKIVSACPWGNYLAIGCAPLGSYGKSIVFLWDRDSSLATLSERIDFGEGSLVHLVNLNNKLIGIMNFYIDDAGGMARGKVLIKQAVGQFGVVLNELTGDTTLAAGTIFQGNVLVKESRAYFAMKLTLDGDTRLGIWSVNELGAATVDFVEEEATSYEGIYVLGSMWWIAHSNDGSVQRSDYDQLAYSTTLSSVYESVIFDGGDARKKKKLVGVTVTTEALPTAGQVVLKYRKDEETSWTTIFTEATDNSISHSAVNIESSGATLPEFKEIQFQINSTGGAVITGLECRFEETEKDLY